MPENTQQHAQYSESQNRRASDQLPHMSLLLEIKSDVQAIRSELIEFKHDVNKAFPKDEDGMPDYIEHRKSHEKQNKEDEKLDEYKTDFAKKFLGWAGIGTLGFLLAAVLNYIKNGNL